MLIALACAVLVSSCNVNDDIEDNSDKGAVRFTAGIDQVATPQTTPGTRASGTTWSSGDAIGIFMVGNGSANVMMSAANKQYTTPTGGSNFAAEAGHEIYYPQTSAVDFIAYYPYNAAHTALGNIDVEIGVQTAQPTFDLLWAKADNSGNGYNKDADAGTMVALAFEHKLAKLTMDCKADPSLGVGNLDGMTVSITGMNTRNTFGLGTGTFVGTPADPAPIEARQTTRADGFDATYDAIILPAGYATNEVKVTFTVGGDPFVWDVPATTFEGGNDYIYAINITRTGVGFTGTIKPWNTINGGPATAE